MVSRSSLVGRKVPLRLQQPVAGDDFDETKPGSWRTIASYVATIRPLPAGPEFVDADQMKATRRSLTSLRKRGGICYSSSQRFVRVDNGKIYHIAQVDALDDREQWYQFAIVETDLVCSCPPTNKLCTCA